LVIVSPSAVYTGTEDPVVLRRAMKRMKRREEKAWLKAMK
jgi:hypothetical protein